MKKNNSDVFFVCSLIEYIGRTNKLKRSDVVKGLGKDRIKHIYEYADVLHCEPMERVAYEFTEQASLPRGDFDNVAKCKYLVPDYWTIGEVYERLIEDVFEEEKVVDGIYEVYTSWMDDRLSDYNTDLYYQPRDYIAQCYIHSEIL